MQPETVPNLSPKSSVEVKVRVDVELLRSFDLSRPVQIPSREQHLRILMRAVARQKELNLLSEMNDLPQFELISLEDAREFLRPFFHGRLISKDTLERRIADGSIIAWKESDNRTATRWILKASIIAWMKRIGRELESEMMP